MFSKLINVFALGKRKNSRGCVGRLHLRGQGRQNLSSRCPRFRGQSSRTPSLKIACLPSPEYSTDSKAAFTPAIRCRGAARRSAAYCQQNNCLTWTRHRPMPTCGVVTSFSPQYATRPKSQWDIGRHTRDQICIWRIEMTGNYQLFLIKLFLQLTFAITVIHSKQGPLCASSDESNVLRAAVVLRTFCIPVR